MDLGDRLRLFELVYSSVKKRIIEATQGKPKGEPDDASSGQHEPGARENAPPLKADH